MTLEVYECELEALAVLILLHLAICSRGGVLKIKASQGICLYRTL